MTTLVAIFMFWYSMLLRFNIFNKVISHRINNFRDITLDFCQKFKCQKYKSPEISIINIFFHTSVNGGFSEWSSWSKCNTTCGNGVQTRSRLCSNPPPRNGGKECVGPYEENLACAGFQCNGKLSVSGILKL